MSTEQSSQLEDKLIIQRILSYIEVVTLEGKNDISRFSIYNFETISAEQSKHQIVQAAKNNQMAVLNSSIEIVKNIFELIDEEKRTVLHYLALNKNFYVFNRLISTYPQQIENWLKIEDAYGLQAVHYVVFRGKMEVYDQIKEIYCPQRVLGMAAAGNDLAFITTILLDKQFNKMNQNYKGNVTPLHLACYFKSDQAAIVLMRQRISDINSQDENGNTPLHICAKVENNKLIRKIIQRGGKISIKNLQNQTPIDIADNSETLEALKSFRFTFKSLFLQLNIKPRKRSIVQSLIFFIFFLVINVGSVFLLFEYHTLTQVPITFLFIMIVGLLTAISFFIASQSNPGYALAQKISNIPDLIDKYQYFDICLDCYIKLPPRSKHCEFCRRCVYKYDHHCPWINNCVGRDNLKSFFTFVSMLSIDFIYLLILSLIVLVNEYYLSPSEKHISESQQIFLIILVIGEALFLIPLGNLLLTQIKNIYLNQTTYERLILCKPRTKKRESIIQNMTAYH